ncbi:type II toxin-antitoxin system RelE/ParE family toxin [Flavobacterium litorale]|uniref:Type II toxin-antitoxin system RelE/ParE family toxin n=1 Tax=Flavobacterium litorale TaxID=2856519 RepID=A0ABX8V8Q1_9FLAO|nr:type II toxin-antitoxin system RelE/ParE family toxin [Flavobacterium litorale]QYJ67210.1 type II toxin-antitoxin system RelE/ParE family toxin [Flavobacterium litorale]
MIIEWSPLAKSDYWKNIEYLEKNWSPKEVVSFIKEVEYHIMLLQNDTVHFTKTGYKNVFKIVVVKQISLFYRINNTTIELLRFWNNYQDLNKFKLK